MISRTGLRRDALVAIALFGTALALAAGARYQLIEPAALAHACTEDAGSALCRMRALLILSFRHQAPGWVAALAGASACLLALRGGAFRQACRTDEGHAPGLPPAAVLPPAWRTAYLCGLTAIVFGAIGLMLYSFDPAAVGVVLGAMALARLAWARHGSTTSR